MYSSDLGSHVIQLFDSMLLHVPFAVSFSVYTVSQNASFYILNNSTKMNRF